MSDLNDLMARVDEINAKSPPYTEDDITTIIAYHRNNRARRAAGEKPTKPKVDIAAILGSVRSSSKPSASAPSPFRGKL